MLGRNVSRYLDSVEEVSSKKALTASPRIYNFLSFQILNELYKIAEIR